MSESQKKHRHQSKKESKQKRQKTDETSSDSKDHSDTYHIPSSNPKDSFSSISSLTSINSTPQNDSKIGQYESSSSNSINADIPKRFHDLELCKDEGIKPLWVCPDGRIFLETFSPLYKQAYDFLITIAEPVCRPAMVHEYQLTPHSLYAAVSVGLKAKKIISVLDSLSKTKLSRDLERVIKECTTSFGKVKLVLRMNRYFVETIHKSVFETLKKDQTVRSAIIQSGDEVQEQPKQKMPEELDLEEEEEQVKQIPTYSFEIASKYVEMVKRRCTEIDLPILEEYDFKKDRNPNSVSLDIDLKPSTIIRQYQQKSLSKMFSEGRARSGIIVLPCGAGKTLVGITAACTIKKPTLVLCNSGVSVEQWKHQFLLWSNLQESSISLFTSGHPDEIDGTVLTISTYSMISHSGPRGQQALSSMQKISKREWGLLLLDEVHVVPATLFRQVLSLVPAHCKLGLTATLVREDDRIGELNYLIGPKLYEANWLDLQRAGHLASVQCCEVWCPMTPLFYGEYLRTADAAKHQMLYAMNPIKMQSCQRLIEYHESKGDKILVFSDNVFALKEYAARLGNRPCIYGKTPEDQRASIIYDFKTKAECKCIFISKVGDTSIDLPEATVIIQISSHYGSRRQEAQRLGRILRPKRGSEPGHTHAYFYSLVSQDTSEMYYCTKRQRFLVDQGYSFKVLREIPPLPNSQEKLVFGSLKEQEELLQKVINYKDSFKEELPFKDLPKPKKQQKSVTDRLTARLKQLPKS